MYASLGEEFVDGEESTWVGTRDIGPAAFDKRLNGYRSVIKRVKQLRHNSEEHQPAQISVQTAIPMTEIKFDEKTSLVRQTKRRIRRILFGK